MKKYKIVIIISVLLISSCATQSVLPPPQWSFEKDGIHIRLKADSRLNWYGGSAHSLRVCVYQLNEPNAFNQLTDNKENFSTLLKCSRFDPGVAGFHSFSIQPGKQISETLDRAEGAKYVAIVSGYYYFHKENMYRCFEIPTVIEKSGWIKRKVLVKPGPLNILLNLGPEQIR